MTGHELEEQDGLPGGRIGPPGPEHDHGVRTWAAAARGGHAGDPQLERTTVHWQEPKEDKPGGWYVLTNEAPAGRCITRTGPFPDTETLRLEEHVQRLAGTDPEQGDEDTIHIVAEGLNRRVADAASRLHLQLGMLREADALAGRHVCRRHEADRHLAPKALEENAALSSAFDALRDAIETRTLWQET